MQVLMLTTSYPMYPGETTAPFIEEIAVGLAERGHTIHVVAPWHPQIRREPLERGVRLHFFRYAPTPDLNVWGYAQSLYADTFIRQQTLLVLPFALVQSVRALQAVIRQQAQRGLPPFGLVHAHWVLPNAAPAGVVARLTGLPLVVSLHGNDIYMAERYGVTTPVAGLSLRAAAAVTACSRDLHHRSIRLGAPPARSHVIPYGIHPAEFRPDAAARTTVRAELGIPADTPLVVGLGRLVHKKGFNVLLDAWATVLQAHPQAVLAIVGYGDLREPLEQQAVQLGVSGQVRFTGQLERQRAAAYLAAADVFALPIVRDLGTDGLPNVLLEAMSSGKAIVASDVAGVPDVLDDGVHGLVVPERDPAALARAICDLLHDPARAAAMGTAARERIQHDLTWAHTAARFDAVYAAVTRQAVTTHVS